MKIEKLHKFPEVIKLSNYRGVVKLFDLYRQFYNKEPDYDTSRDYVSTQLQQGRTTILVATDNESVTLGFIQFGSRICSCVGKVLLLNDLFVHPLWRGRGVGRALMEAALEYGKEEGASVVELETEVNNIKAQQLYESLGYKPDTRYVTYTRGIK